MKIPESKSWAGKVLLHTPDSLRRIRSVPVIGSIVHSLSRQVLAADELVWAQVEAGLSKGLWLELNPRTGQSYLRGQAELNVQDVVAKQLRPGMTFYDFGANIGLFSLLGARLVGPTGRVFSFDPDPVVAARLRRNVERNGFSNVTVIEAGIWSRTGEMAFVPADESSPDHGTGSLAMNTDGLRLRVQCVSLDDFAQKATPPDAIKCDIEGAEVEMLVGAKDVLRSRRPWILCEMHSESNDHACRTILNEFGYGFEAVDSNHVLAVPLGDSA